MLGGPVARPVGVGAPPVDQSLTIHGVVGVVGTEKRLLGCLLGSCDSHREIPRLLALWKAGRLDLDAMITSRRPLADIGSAIEDIEARRGIRTVLKVGR